MHKFQPENEPKAFGGRAEPGPAGEAYNRPPSWVYQRGQGQAKEEGENTGWGVQLREENRERKEGAREGEEGRKGGDDKGRRNREISPPQSVISESQRLCTE